MHREDDSVVSGFSFVHRVWQNSDFTFARDSLNETGAFHFI